MPRTFAETLSFLLRYREQPHGDVAARAREHGLAGATTEWLDELAAGSVLASPAEQRALAQALAVPEEYFTDARITTIVDAVLVLASALRQQNMQVIGPCRHGPGSVQDYLAMYVALLSR